MTMLSARVVRIARSLAASARIQRGGLGIALAATSGGAAMMVVQQAAQARAASDCAGGLPDLACGVDDLRFGLPGGTISASRCPKVVCYHIVHSPAGSPIAIRIHQRNAGATFRRE
jgi:hypothetical protein